MEANVQLNISILVIDGLKKGIDRVCNRYKRGQCSYSYLFKSLLSLSHKVSLTIDTMTEYGILTKPQANSLNTWVDEMIHCTIDEI